VGAMIAQPGVRLRVSESVQCEVVGPLRRRVVEVLQGMSAMLSLTQPPACRIEVLEAPSEHTGLGTGTQLSLAVVAGVHAFRGGEPLSAFALAALSGRGQRSAVGTHGFASGGLIGEAGKLPHELLAPLGDRIEIPPAWRFVLLSPRHAPGLSGDEERSAFRDLPPVPRWVTGSLMREIVEKLLPAAEAGDFERFSDSLYRYGHQAGMCFADRQGGAFASRQIATLVHTIRQMGVTGVGQSSWGPSVFALLENGDAAQRFVERLRPQLVDETMVIVSEPDNAGARVTRVTAS
jgi:beta-ribofuranosylaminobenzene 5'-phosphate synthase